MRFCVSLCKRWSKLFYTQKKNGNRTKQLKRFQSSTADANKKQCWQPTADSRHTHTHTCTHAHAIRPHVTIKTANLHAKMKCVQELWLLTTKAIFCLNSKRHFNLAIFGILIRMDDNSAFTICIYVGTASLCWMAIHLPRCRADLQFSALYNIFKRLPTIFRSKHTNRKHAHRPHLLIRQTKTKGSGGAGGGSCCWAPHNGYSVHILHIWNICTRQPVFFSLLLNTSYMNCVYGRNNSQILYRTISCSLLWKRFYFAATICTWIRKILFTSLLFAHPATTTNNISIVVGRFVCVAQTSQVGWLFFLSRSPKRKCINQVHEMIKGFLVEINLRNSTSPHGN